VHNAALVSRDSARPIRYQPDLASALSAFRAPPADRLPDPSPHSSPLLNRPNPQRPLLNPHGHATMPPGQRMMHRRRRNRCPDAVACYQADERTLDCGARCQEFYGRAFCTCEQRPCGVVLFEHPIEVVLSGQASHPAINTWRNHSASQSSSELRAPSRDLGATLESYRRAEQPFIPPS
jgi:hypothetical protein